MKSFLNALRGLSAVAKKERNMRIHLCFAFYVVLAGFVTRLAASEWARVLLCIALVCSMECLNSALESACDKITAKSDGHIKYAKDAAAGAVLISAIMSALIGCLTFLRPEKLSATREFIVSNPIASALIVLALIPWCIYIFGKQKRGPNK